MIRYTFKMQQAYEEGFKEGVAEASIRRSEQAYKKGLYQAYELGLETRTFEEVYRARYADWEKRKAAAAAKEHPI